MSTSDHSRGTWETKIALPPNVERLEPRLTLSTIRPLRQRAGAAIDHASHTDTPAETQDSPPAPARAQSVDPGAGSDPDTTPAAPDRSFRRLAAPEPHHGDGSSGHGAYGLHVETSPQTGLVALAGDHDPGHFVLVATSQVNLLPLGGTQTANHDPGMAMGPGLTSRVAVSMPMTHPTASMPRMTRTRDAKPVEPPMSHEPGSMEDLDEAREPLGHDLDPGLDPDLSPGPGPEIAPTMAMPDTPMAEIELDRPDDRDPPLPVVAQAVDHDAAGPRVLALTGVAALFHRNLSWGRVEPDEVPAKPAVVARSLRSLLRSLARRLRLSGGR